MYTLDKIKSAVERKKYRWFTGVNIVGVRNNGPSIADKVTNVFDDFITISFTNEKNVTEFYCWNATTDPGKKGVQQFTAKKGVARLVPGQYIGVWGIDNHQGKYPALCQRNGNVTVWRDANRDLNFDEKITESGMFGINIHKAGQDSTWVENWSEGCQVFKRVKDFDEFMRIIRRCAKMYGDKFSYTLIESTDIV